MSDADARVAAIVLAAGDSTRMGSQKLLLPFGGKTVVQHIVDVVKSDAVSLIVVVTGRDGERVAEVLRDSDVLLASNSDPDRGMLSSLRIGIEEIQDKCDAYIVVLGDQPSIRNNLVVALVQELKRSGEGIVVPRHAGRRGHPLLISGKYTDAILTRYDDEGLRGLLREHAADVRGVEVDESWVLDDMDYPADYERELRRLEED